MKASLLTCVFLTLLCCQKNQAQTESQMDTSKNNFVIVSAIKSIAGERPANEFFDFNLKLYIDSQFATLMSVDLALSAVGSDSVGGTQKKLTEGGIFAAYQFTKEGEGKQRSFVLGGTLKFFNEIPYVGIHVGAVELASSRLLSSYFVGSFLWRLQSITPDIASVDRIAESYQAWYVEFALHSESSTIGLIKSLRIKGGILMPWKELQVTGVHSRIVIEVPIDGLFKF